MAHARIQRGNDALSTIDIVGRGEFTLVTGIDDAHWREAVEALNRELGTSIRVVQVAARGEYDDVYGDWARIRGVEDSGALLVRPDRVVAWREPGRPADAAEALRGVLDTVLARG